MENTINNKGKEKKKLFFHSKGITYFNRRTERIIFFILTIAMLVWGIFEKMGV